jgi:hypothetical protein
MGNPFLELQVRERQQALLEEAYNDHLTHLQSTLFRVRVARWMRALADKLEPPRPVRSPSLKLDSGCR